MKGIRFKLFLFFIISVSFFIFSNKAEASSCKTSTETTGASFENFENAEYINGFLVLHFKLASPFSGLYPIRADRLFYTDECQNGMDPTAMHGISLTPGTKSFSVRFISQTKYEIWNDETETKENCEGCWELPLFPTYYETSFLFILGADTFQSASHHIIENPAPPPVKNSTLPVPEECAPSRFSKVSAIGYFFDKYEKAEYMKGLLVYHFRLLPPRNYGQNWYMNFSLFDKDCYYGADYGHGLTPENFYSTSIKPWSRYYSVRFTSPTHYEIWNDETETKETCASCSKDIPSILPNGSEAKFFTVRFSVPGGMGGDSFFSSSYFSIEEPKPKQNPVLIIPGMIGSELYNEDDFIWMDKGQIASDIRDDFLKQLNLDSNGHSINSISVGNLIDEININIPALGRILILDIFKGLIKDFKSNGYVVNKSYFVFPYDWRINLDRSIESLRQKINEIKSETGSNKVDIVVHSMGGLLIKDYINEYSKESIDKLIFVGTPHLGSPESMRVILEGDQLRLPFLTRGRIQEIAVNSPAMYELLPSPTYFEKLSGYIKPFSFIFDKKLYNYDETRSHITKEGGNNNVFGQAETFFDKNLANIDLSGIDAYNISGCKTATPISYKLALMGGIGKINYGPGDGTVPIGSGDYLNIPESNKYYVAGTEHAELPSAKDVRGAILNILYGRSATTTKNFSKDFSTCGIKGKLLSWHSPVDVSVYDSEGNHSGPLENNFEFGIPGVNYIISGHNKFIFLPTDENRQYRIEGQGTDKGTFDLLISEYDDSQVIKTDVFNDVRVSTSTLVQFNISATSTDDSILVNDENIFEISELTGDQGEDVAPPQTSIKINDSSEIKNWYKDAEVSLESIDDDSGIFETRYSTDGENFSTYSSPFHISGEGTTTIKYYSIDKAGNNEEIKTASFYIDNTPPEFKTFFDLNTKSIVFLAFDNLDASPDISCAEILCAAIDKAGNETILNFKQKNYLGDFSLNLSSIIYNGITNNFIENEFEVDIEKKSGVIKNFRQEFSWDERNRIKIEYKKSKDESLIKEYAEKGRDKTTKVPGIKFLQVITNKGKILTVIK